MNSHWKKRYFLKQEGRDGSFRVMLHSPLSGLFKLGLDSSPRRNTQDPAEDQRRVSQLQLLALKVAQDNMPLSNRGCSPTQGPTAVDKREGVRLSHKEPEGCVFQLHSANSLHHRLPATYSPIDQLLTWSSAKRSVSSLWWRKPPPCSV